MSSLWDDLSWLLGKIRWHEPEVVGRAVEILATYVPKSALEQALKAQENAHR